MTTTPFPTENVAGRTFLVTGANSGIGRATAEKLAAMGGTVILAGRSAEKMQPVMDAIRETRPDAAIEFLFLDLADFASIRSAAAMLLASSRTLDVLINNAGLAAGPELTKDGFDMTIGTNHLGPFLFTQLLLPKLEAAPQGRIVNVASQAHRNVRHVDWGWLTSPPTPGERRGGLGRYNLSKLMNILYTRELAKLLTGTRVTTYALHPGVVASNIWRRAPRPVQWIMKRFMISNEQGAETSVYCATAPALSTVSGRYYDNCREATPSPLARDDALAHELFALSEKAVAMAAAQTGGKAVGQNATGT